MSSATQVDALDKIAEELRLLRVLYERFLGERALPAPDEREDEVVDKYRAFRER